MTSQDEDLRAGPRFTVRSFLERLDRLIPLPLKVGIAIAAITGAGGVAVGLAFVRLLDGLRPDTGLPSASELNQAIDRAAQSVAVVLAATAAAALAGAIFVLYWFVFRRTARLRRAAARAGGPQPQASVEPRSRDALAQVALEFDAMVRTLEARTRQQAAVAELGQLALSGVPTPVLLDEAARLVAQGLGAEFGTVLELLADKFVIRSGVGWDEGVIGGTIPLRSQSGYTLGSSEPVLVEDLRTETRFPMTPVLREHGVRSGASVTIPGPGGPFGVLTTHDTRPRTFSSDDLHFLRSLAVTLGSAIRHREAQRELLAAEARYRTLVERVPAVTYTAGFGRHGAWQFVSPQVEAMLGFPSEDWVRDPELWWRRLHAEDRDRVVAEEEAERRDPPEGSVTTEYRMIARDGRVVWVRDEAVVVRDDRGRPLFYQGLMSDISEEKAAQEALREAYDREREAAERLRALDEMKNAFLTAVSHELRTPLASILGYALTLEREEITLGDGERREMLSRLAANARKLDRFLADLLDVEQLSKGVIEPRREAVDVAELVREIVSGVDLGGRAVTVEVEPVEAEVDGPKVERIVENLLQNVTRHTPGEASVWIRVWTEGTGVIIAVEDDGPGIPDEHKEQVFEPFVRGPRVPPHVPGTGVGLSLVAKFAELHGGRAWVEDRPGGGSSFRVSLPRDPQTIGLAAS